jgi:hyaluronan synthase
MAKRKVTPGALSPYYEIPTCEFRSKPGIGLVLTSAFMLLLIARYCYFAYQYVQFWPLAVVWILPLVSMVLQWLVSWFDQPVKVTAAQAERLAKLNVVINIPTFNEDPGLLDRAIYALVNQTRTPQRVDIVDDGSDKSDYTVLREYWTQRYRGPVEIVFVRHERTGKKGAQAETFANAPEADVFGIIDSDTCLDSRALEEALKPLIDPEVASSAGIELPMNSKTNWLTRSVGVRSAFFQYLSCSAQSAMGDLLINRGAFFLIRAQVVRDALPAYLNETFLGHPIKLGDDAALTLFARASGKTVQQPSAFALTMYPETLSHHLRQWLRWMRGSTIRTCWRLRYLSVTTFGWWFSLLGVYSFLMSTLFPILLVLMLPGTAWAALYVLLAMCVWSYIYGLRTLCIRRSDESWWYRIGSMLTYPLVLLWGLFVLRPIRVYGVFTCLNQGWTTRESAVEISLNAALAEESAV